MAQSPAPVPAQGRPAHHKKAIALAVAAAELLRHAPSLVSDAYCASRLAPSVYAGAAFGCLPEGSAATAILARALPG